MDTTSEVAVEILPEERTKSFYRRTAHNWDKKRWNVHPMARQIVFLEVDSENDAELRAVMYYRERGFVDEDDVIFVKIDIEKEAGGRRQWQNRCDPKVIELGRLGSILSFAVRLRSKRI